MVVDWKETALKAHELAKRLLAGPDLEVGFSAEGQTWMVTEFVVEENEFVMLKTLRFGQEEDNA